MNHKKAFDFLSDQPLLLSNNQISDSTKNTQHDYPNATQINNSPLQNK